MRCALVLILFLCFAAAARANGSPALVDPTRARTDDDRRFAFVLRGVTGDGFNVGGDLAPGRRRAFTAVTSQGGNLMALVELHTGSPGKWLLQVKLVEYPRTGPAFSCTLSAELAPGESWVGGKGWNSLFEMRLIEK